MTARSLSILIGSITFILFGGIFIASQYSDTAGTPTPSFEVPESVTVSRTYAQGTHTLRGSLMTETACYDLRHTETIAESFPEQVTIDMEVSAFSDHCLETPTRIPFEVQVSASPQAIFRMRINEESVELNISGETQNDTFATSSQNTTQEDRSFATTSTSTNTE